MEKGLLRKLEQGMAMSLLLLLAAAETSFAQENRPESIRACLSQGIKSLEATAKAPAPTAKSLSKRYGDVHTAEKLVDLLHQIRVAQTPEAQALKMVKSVHYIRYFNPPDAALSRILASVQLLGAEDREGIKNAVANEFTALRTGRKHWTARAGEYDVELPEIDVDDQCESETCWLHAANVEKSYLLRSQTGTKDLVSVEYPYIQMLHSEFIYWLKHPKLINEPKWNFYGTTPDDFLPWKGGTFEKALTLDRQFGVIPRSAWRPKKDPFKNTGGIIAQMKKVLKNLGAAVQADPKGVVKYRRHALKELKLIDEKYFGEIPDPRGFHFSFDGKAFTPESFHDAYFTDQGVVRYPSKDFILEGYHFETLSRSSEVSASIQYSLPAGDFLKVAEVIHDELARGHAPQLSYYTPKYARAINKATGKMTANRAYQIDADGLHGVDIVGCELDPFGNIKQLKIQDNHGRNRGDRGFFHMDANFFRRFYEGVEVRVSDPSLIFPPVRFDTPLNKRPFLALGLHEDKTTFTPLLAPFTKNIASKLNYPAERYTNEDPDSKEYANPESVTSQLYGFQEFIEGEIFESPESKLILFNLDGIDLKEAAESARQNDRYTAAELRMILTTAPYLERTRFFRHGQELGAEAVSTLVQEFLAH